MLKDPNNWARIAPYLDQALDLSGDERTTWLKQLEQTDSETARDVRILLGELEDLNRVGYLEGSPLRAEGIDGALPALQRMVRERVGVESGDWLGRSPGVAQSLAKDDRPTGLVAGGMLGVYRLIREIGHGGMSTVWLAERDDGQLKRQVALKLPFSGPLRAQMAERFKRERDILAALTHPNIARLYDAGIAESTQSYLAMEYVPGYPLTHYCDAGRLSIRDRLQLFLQVLAAVGFAHSQLILHRDLKPSNILVTQDGRVVLLDFGVAKMLSQQPGTDLPLTEMAARALTPQYASPELISGQMLSTTSDVYSLGVVLYELLTGERPFGSKGDSLRALEDAILKQDPRRPSQLIFTLEAAAARHGTPRKLSQVLKGDLDTIVLKALKKAPGERYLSIGTFAKDIENYLESLPVSARPDSAWYRIGRFTARYKLQVGAATVALLAIVAGGLIAAWQAHSAAEQRDRAVTLASQNESINEFMSLLISEAASSEKPLTVSEMLDHSVKLALANTDESTDNRAAILATVADLYNVSGQSGKAAELLERAKTDVRDSRNGDLKSQIQCAHAWVAGDTGQTDAALMELTHELENTALAPENAVACLHGRSVLAFRAGDAQGSLRYALMALDEFHKSARQTRYREAILMGRIADSYHQVGETARANHYYELAAHRYVEAGREQTPSAMILENNWAVALSSIQPKRALEVYDRLQRLVLERDPSSEPPPPLLANRGRALELIGRFEKAHSAYEQALRLARQSKNIAFQGFSLLGLASVSQQSGDHAAAERYLAELTKITADIHSAGHPLLVRRAVVEGWLDLAENKTSEARDKFASVLALHGKNAQGIGAALGKAEAELAAGDAVAALADARSGLELAKSLQGTLEYSNHTGLSWLVLGRALQAHGDGVQAHEAFQSAVVNLSNTVDANHPDLVRARNLLSGHD
jgi:eukaryotic-like serine/threonine-protein kinase